MSARRAPGVGRAPGVRRGTPSEAQRFGELFGRLTARDRWLLAMLAEHSVLTTSHLLALGWASGRRQAQARARVLHEAGVLDRFRPLLPRGEGSAPWHFLLGPHGAAALAAETGHTVAEIGYRGRARALGVAHRMTLAHDIACNGLIADLTAAPGVGLRQWWSAARCRRCFGHHVRPDAYLTLTTAAPGRPGGGWWEMFLEYDTGSETLGRLAAKLTGYHELATATGITTPVGIWITRPGREPGARRALVETLRALPHPHLVPVLTAVPHPDPHPEQLPAPGRPGPTAPDGPPGHQGAAGRVWLPVVPPGRTAQRVSLAALAAPRALPSGGEPYQPVGPDQLDQAGGSRDTSVLAAPPPYPPGPDGAW